MIHFKLIFVEGVKSKSEFIFLACGYPVVLAPFVEKLSFVHCIAFAVCSSLDGVTHWASLYAVSRLLSQQS